MRSRGIDAAYAIGTIVVCLLAWQGLVTALDVPSFFIPAPSEIAVALVRGLGLYSSNYLVTLYSTLLAFGIAFITGLLLGALVSEIRFLRRTLYPLLIALQSMPRIALAPIIIVWFGFGMSSKVVLGAISAFFPIFMNTVHGMVTIEPEQIALMRSLRASRMQMFWKVKLPGTLPFLLAGANIGIIFAILAVIVGEFLGANRGMGFLIVNESSQMDTAGVFASILVLSATGIAFHYGIAYLRTRLLAWSANSEIGGSDV